MSHIITDIEYVFKNAKQLYLYNQKIKEIKDLNKHYNDYIEYLYNISSLNIKIKWDFSTFNLKDIEILDLGDNCIKEIKGLDNLNKLKHLFLRQNFIKEMKRLDKLTELEVLVLNHNFIKEIKGLDKSINMKELYLFNNQIKEIKSLNNLINLYYIDYLDKIHIKEINIYII